MVTLPKNGKVFLDASLKRTGARLTEIRKKANSQLNGKEVVISYREYKPSEKDRQDILTMAAYGIPQNAIARILNIHTTTLVSHFSKELASARWLKAVEVGNALYQNAISGNVVAQIFYLKTQGGWKSADRVGVTDVPPPMPTKYDYSRLTDAEIRTWMDLSKKASSPVIDIAPTQHSQEHE